MNSQRGKASLTKFIISKEEFLEFRNDKRFHLILKLMRMLNSMKFALSSAVVQFDKDTPASKRDTNASFLYMCSLLYEMFKSDSTKFDCIYSNLKREFHHLESFSKFDEFYEEVHQQKYYAKARDKIMFHFDTDAIEEPIQRVKINTEIILGITHSGNPLDMDFPFSDELIYHFLLGTEEINEESLETFGKLIEKTASLASQVIETSEMIIYEAFQEMGITIELNEQPRTEVRGV